MTKLKLYVLGIIGALATFFALKKRGDIHAARAEQAREGQRRAEANTAAVERLSRHRAAVDRAVIDGQRRAGERVQEAVREAADDENLDHFRR